MVAVVVTALALWVIAVWLIVRFFQGCAHSDAASDDKAPDFGEGQAQLEKPADARWERNAPAARADAN
jgi:hypothetical protein